MSTDGEQEKAAAQSLGLLDIETPWGTAAWYRLLRGTGGPPVFWLSVEPTYGNRIAYVQISGVEHHVIAWEGEKGTGVSKIKALQKADYPGAKLTTAIAEMLREVNNISPLHDLVAGARCFSVGKGE